MKKIERINLIICAIFTGFLVYCPYRSQKFMYLISLLYLHILVTYLISLLYLHIVVTYLISLLYLHILVTYLISLLYLHLLVMYTFRVVRKRKPSEPLTPSSKRTKHKWRKHGPIHQHSLHHYHIRNTSKYIYIHRHSYLDMGVFLFIFWSISFYLFPLPFVLSILYFSPAFYQFYPHKMPNSMIKVHNGSSTFMEKYYY